MTNITEQVIYRIKIFYIQLLVLDGYSKIFLDEVDQLQGKYRVNPALGENIVVIFDIDIANMLSKKAF